METIGGMGGMFQGGFISFPQATLATDPNGGMSELESSPTVSTAGSPTLHGLPQTGLPFYDASERRWVPVAPGQSSPDGSAYAYGLNDGTIHVVNVETGSDRTFAPHISPGQVLVEDFDGSSVFFTMTVTGGHRGVWRLNLASGAVAHLTDTFPVLAVRSGTAWVGLMDPSDPNQPQPTGGEAVFDSLASVLLATGSENVWIYTPGESVTMESVDASGRPIVQVSDPPDYPSGKVLRIDHPGTTRIGGGADIIDARAIGILGALSDGDRIWFGNERGIYLYTPSVGLQKVFAFANSTGVDALFPAGFCR